MSDKFVGKNVLGELEDVLESESTALKNGDIDGVLRLAETKESILQSIKSLDGIDAVSLAGLKDKFAKNQTLFLSAMEGIRFVSDNMKALGQVQRGLDTYDCHGKMQNVTTRSHPKVEKRA